VVRGQELAHLERSPATLQADESFPAGNTRRRRVTGVTGVVLLDLEDRAQSAADVLNTPQTETRRVAAEPGHGWVRAVGLLAADELEVNVQPPIECHVRGLRLRSQRGCKSAGDRKGNELFIHEVSPLTIRLAD